MLHLYINSCTLAHPFCRPQPCYLLIEERPDDHWVRETSRIADSGYASFEFMEVDAARM